MLISCRMAASVGALSADHVEYASDAAIKAMASAGVVAILLPGAFLVLRETRALPIEQLRRHGVENGRRLSHRRCSQWNSHAPYSSARPQRRCSE